MKLKDLLKILDTLTNVVIWTQDDDDEPYFTGSVMDIPWVLLKCKIGRSDKYNVEPVYATVIKNDKGVELPTLVINILL